MPFVGAIDEGTSSTRFFIFNSETSEVVTYHQIEIKQSFPQEGWVEEDPMEILDSVEASINRAVEKLSHLGHDSQDLKCVGISGQGVTTIVWDKLTGQPLHSAITWLDMRCTSIAESLLEKLPNKNADHLKQLTGMPLNGLPSAAKLRWLLDNSEKVKQAVKDGRCLFGTVNTWLIWNLTGGVNGGCHITDVSQASLTMLMNIHTLEWDDTLCSLFDIPKSILPEIRSTSEIYGEIVSGPLQGIPLSASLLDQPASVVGHHCFRAGDAKNTYGTGCFLNLNTGPKPVVSKTGMLTHVAYKFGPDEPAMYCMMGCVNVAGACIRWLRDNLGIISKSEEVGLMGTTWDPAARGIICGLSQFTTKAHIARAALEAVCFQAREVVEAMIKDSGIQLSSVCVDGGMADNDLLMQLQADILQKDVVRPSMLETAALGAAMSAGAADGVNVWDISKEGKNIQCAIFTPSVTKSESEVRYRRWQQAVERSLHWEAASSTLDDSH